MTIAYSQKYAGLIPRCLALCIDSLITNMTLPVALLFLASAHNLTDLTSKLVIYLTVVFIPFAIITIFYYGFSLSKFGKTIGKAILGLTVATDSKVLLSFKMSLFREIIGKSVSAGLFLAGFFAVLFTKDQRTWHDQLADTYVYRKGNRIIVGLLAVVVLLGIYAAILNTTYNTYRANAELQTNFNQELGIPRL